MNKPTPSAVIEAVDSILRQSSAGEHYRPDFTKDVQKAFDAGAESNHVKIHAPPLTEAEIVLFRDMVRTAVAPKSPVPTAPAV